MTSTLGKRPHADWTQFLEAAPYFSSVLWDNIDETDSIYDFSPLVRAVFYYDLFDGETSNGGVTQYFFNLGGSLRGFDEAPALVAAHPLLADAVPFLHEAHTLWDRIRPAVNAARREANAASAAGDEAAFVDSASTLFQDQADTTADFNERFFAVNHHIRMRVYRAFLENPHAYLDLAAPSGITGRGVETAEVEGRQGCWRLRFVDGFPRGPNVCEDPDAPDGMRLLRFTADRMHLDCDRLVSWIPGEFERLWVDYRAGVSSTRLFRDGRLDSVDSQRSLSHSHGLSECYRADGVVRNTDLSLDGQPMIKRFADDSGDVRTIQQRDLDGRRIKRRFHANGRLNTEEEELPDGRTRYACCLDDTGRNLAPRGSGRLRAFVGVFDGCARWRTGKLVRGFLHGEVAVTDDDEPKWVEHFDHGRSRR